MTEQGTRSRRRVYRIADNYLAFYLGPLTRFRAEIERGLGRSIIRSLTAFIDGHMGPVYEEAFREHLRRLANQGSLGEDIAAVGAWWTDDGQQEIDAVVVAQRSLTRVPVLAGESKWASTVNAARIKAGLIRKAASLTPDVTTCGTPCVLATTWNTPKETPSPSPRRTSSEPRQCGWDQVPVPG